MKKVVRVRVGARLSINEAEAPELALKALHGQLTFVNPEHAKRERYGRYTGKTAPFLRYYESRNGWTHIPRGAYKLVRDTIRKHDGDPKFLSSAVITRSRGLVPIEDFSVSLRDYQEKCRKLMHTSVQGIVQMPCGSGKTETGAAAILSTGEPGLILVHTEDIMDQWVNRIRRMYDEKPRIIAGTRKSDFRPLNPGEMAIGMIQTLSSAGPIASDFLGSVGAVLTDECHHVPAKTWLRIINACAARYRWGLTATPVRSDGLDFVLPLLMGPTIFMMTTNQLIADGYLNMPTIVPVWTGWVAPEYCYVTTAFCPSCHDWIPTQLDKHTQSGTWCRSCQQRIPKSSDVGTGKINYSKAQTEATTDPGRQQIIRNLTRLAVNDGRTVLVLVPRKNAVYQLVSLLRNDDIEAVGVTSDYSKSIRAEHLNDIRYRRASVIVATQLADEGLDLPAVDCAINTSGGRNTGTARQRIGRTLRKSGKLPVIFELVDTGEFEAQWDVRRRAYEKEYGQRCLAYTSPVEPQEAAKILQTTRRMGF